jgi:ABC-type transport system substrate-binding protein
VRQRRGAGRLGAVATAVAVALGGCRAGGQTVRPHRASPPITVAVAGDFPTLDPAQAADTESVSAIQLMYETLFSYDARGRLVGRLAASWRWSEGGRVLTVVLNRRARFADGTPVTAADVAFSLDRMLDAATHAPEAASFDVLQGFAQLRAGTPWLSTGIVQRGPWEVVFHLTHPAPYLPELLALPSASVVERRLVVAAGSQAARPSWWFSHSAGSGPYVLGRLVPGASLLLRPNPRYWRRGVRQDGLRVGPFAPVLFRVVSSPTQQLSLFRAGALDVVDPVPAGALAGFAAPLEGARLLQGAALGVAYLGFETARPPFDRWRVRLAAAYALDKQAILAAAGGVGEVAGGLLPPGVAGYDPDLRPYPYDPARAKRLLREAGLPEPVPVTLLTVAASGTVQAGEDQVAQTVASELDAVGFAVTVRAVPWPTYYQDLAEGSSNLFQDAWIADYPDAQDFFFNLLDSAAVGQSNAAFFSNAAFDRLLAQAAETTDPALRARRYAALDAWVYHAVPLVPEFYVENTVLVQPWVHPATLGVFLDPPLMPRLEFVRVTPPPSCCRQP